MSSGQEPTSTSEAENCVQEVSNKLGEGWSEWVKPYEALNTDNYKAICEECKTCMNPIVEDVSGVQLALDGRFMNWTIKWKLPRPAPCDGYIIQEVRSDIERHFSRYVNVQIYNPNAYTSIDRTTYKKELKYYMYRLESTYFEVWKVKKGDTIAYSIFSDGSEGKGEDNFGYLEDAKDVYFVDLEIRGRARYCPSEETIENLGFFNIGETYHAPQSGDLKSIYEYYIRTIYETDENYLSRTKIEDTDDKEKPNENENIQKFLEKIDHWLKGERTKHELILKYNKKFSPPWNKPITEPKNIPVFYAKQK